MKDVEGTERAIAELELPWKEIEPAAGMTVFGVA